MVVGNRRDNVMCNMGGTDAVMKEVQESTVGPVDCVESAFSPGPILLVKVWNVDVGVLEPGVKDKP